MTLAQTGTALLCLIIGISDGDTLTARCGAPSQYQQVKVRLAAIDAPERGQPYGQRSKQALSSLCYMQQATIRQVDQDRYKRIVAEVTCQGQLANQWMVRNGWAWVYDKYASGYMHWHQDQHAANAERRGLWQDAHAVPPWEWRKQTKQHATTTK